MKDDFAIGVLVGMIAALSCVLLTLVFAGIT